MNYYKRHIGDYAAATRHLSMVEHGAYALLLDIYYASESPIPSDLKAAARKVGARTKDEIAAVETVLNEFFALKDDGWHQSRCDEEITKKVERSEFNKTVGVLGGRPKKVKTETQAVSKNNPNGFETETQAVSKNNPSHKPIANSQERASEVIGESTGVTPAGLVCARLKSECRIQAVNPQHPKLLALLDAGLTPDEIVSAGHDANGKGFAWVLATAEGRRRDAASVDRLPEASRWPNGKSPFLGAI